MGATSECIQQRCAELGIYPHRACGCMLIVEERTHISAE